MDPWGVIATSVSKAFSSIPRLLVVNGITQLFWLSPNPSWGDPREEDKSRDVGLTFQLLGLAEFSICQGPWPYLFQLLEKHTLIARPSTSQTIVHTKTFIEHLVCPRYYDSTAGKTEMDQVWHKESHLAGIITKISEVWFLYMQCPLALLPVLTIVHLFSQII